MAVFKRIMLWLLVLAVAAGSLGVTGILLLSVAVTSGSAESNYSAEAVDAAIMDRYDMYITNCVSSALEGVLAIDKVYWLHDSDQVAPEPDQSKFGKAKTPAELAWLLEEAKPLLDGQDTLFRTDLTLAQGTDIGYYLDDTIMAITWKQAFDHVMYTISEVKIAHPSQLRRFLAGGTYGSPIQLTTSDMAASVNAVVASSGDFYGFRRLGVVVYDGTVQRVNSERVDTCYIDEQGDLHFSYRGQLPDMESAQAFVDEHNIRFSLAFGPALIADGEPIQIKSYYLGEIADRYSRAGIGQLGELHYILVTANFEYPYGNTPTIYEFRDQLLEFGCHMAYALDGGQTAVIVMNDKVINNVVYGYQRAISDIIYFATAIPEREQTPAQ